MIDGQGIELSWATFSDTMQIAFTSLEPRRIGAVVFIEGREPVFTPTTAHADWDDHGDHTEHVLALATLLWPHRQISLKPPDED